MLLFVVGNPTRPLPCNNVSDRTSYTSLVDETLRTVRTILADEPGLFKHETMAVEINLPRRLHNLELNLYDSREAKIAPGDIEDRDMIVDWLDTISKSTFFEE